MFSHVMVGTNDLERAKSFYDALLGSRADTFSSHQRQGLWVAAFAGTTRCESAFSRRHAPEVCK